MCRSTQYVCRVPPPSTDISKSPADTRWSPPASWTTASPKVFRPSMVAVAPPSVCGATSAAAVPAPDSIPAATSPDTVAVAARRATAVDRQNPDSAASTEFPFEQDPSDVGEGPTSRIGSPEGHARHPMNRATPPPPVG
ncbi:hypothetical protein SGPA1_30353 [Streptomyces misionensis JCM 4497]